MDNSTLSIHSLLYFEPLSPSPHTMYAQYYATPRSQAQRKTTEVLQPHLSLVQLDQCVILGLPLLKQQLVWFVWIIPIIIVNSLSNTGFAVRVHWSTWLRRRGFRRMTPLLRERLSRDFEVLCY
ncbi:hypothetical protein EJ02DRAFT_161356 [Clathrospora elynae]|uniref:Uncharacterized protein n=1 Tax=Clathrospora elynae TaxID=706981 RepID=A0A6A5ST45_9PLEO|nr:hypothetical protein EJ02DRAFT_161356 [Clathrospora elynae]